MTASIFREDRWGDTDMEFIYKAYPRHVGRRDALKAINRALHRIAGRRDAPEDPVIWLITRVRLFAGSPKGQSGQFCPHPATWFNQDRFDDNEAEWFREDTSKKTLPFRPDEISKARASAPHNWKEANGSE